MRGRPDRVLGLLLALSVTSAAAADCHRIDLVEAGTGRPVVGVEDIRIAPSGEVAFLSAYDRRVEPPAEGAVHVLRLADLAIGAGPVAVRALRPSSAAAGGFRPHGLALAADGDLVVINRRRDAATGQMRPTLDRLTPTADGVALAASVQPTGLCNPNAVLVEPDGSLLVSNDRAACAPWRRRLESWAGLANGGVFRLDGHRVDAVATALDFANGLARAQGALWVAETRARRLRSLSDDRVLLLPMAPDNLTVDDRGRLWVAGPVNLVAYAAFVAGVPGFDRAASRVAVVADGHVRTVLDDDGGLVAGATVAAAHGDDLVVGAAFDTAIVHCRLDG